jgi:hypothetical protein
MLADLSSRASLPAIDFHDYFKLGDIGYGPSNRLLFCHNLGFKCNSLNLVRHVHDTITNTHTLNILQTLPLVDHYIYGYKKIDNVNTNIVFGRIGLTDYKVWYLEMTANAN